MSINQEVRPRYSEGQYLAADDLSAGIVWALGRDQRHLLGAHTWGIAAGLQLQEVASFDGASVDVYVRPGYAWDGFGRPIVVPAPYQISTDLFQAFTSKSTDGSSQRIPVWLQYDEVATQRAQPGFAPCTSADTSSRVVETFRLVVGSYNTNASQRDPISVAGQSIDASGAYQNFITEDGLLTDGSVPFQSLPEAGATARWLIPLGFVTWQPNATQGQTGNFVPNSERDNKLGRAARTYIGVVAESLVAPDGVLRLADRTRDYRKSDLHDHDLVRVEGALRAEGPVRLWNAPLEFRDQNGDHGGTSLLISRNDDAASGTTSLDVQLGAKAGTARFGVGPLNDKGTAIDEKFVVLDSGNVGIGTSTPTVALDVGGDLNVSVSARKPGGGTWTHSSDSALKKNIQPLPAALEKLLRLRGVQFQWREPERMGGLTGIQTGLVAQEVEQVFPEWIGVAPNGYKEMTIRGFEALTVEALRDLQNQVRALQARVEELEARSIQNESAPQTTPRGRPPRSKPSPKEKQK